MSNSKQNLVPAAREALDKFKMEAASNVGINLKQGYSGELTSKQTGSVSGQMVKNVCAVRLTKKAVFQRENRIMDGHKQTVKYIAGIAIQGE